MSEYRLVMKGVVKTFPGVKALDHAQLELRPGKVMALMGENGAGKSTLMKCMFGIYKMDEGEIEYEGEKVNIPTPLDALNRGIAMVHHMDYLIWARTVAENIWLGRYPTKKAGPITIVDHAKMYKDTDELLKKLKLDIKSHAKLGTLSIAQMQMVEIAKAVSANCKVLILDEPTSSLTANEVESLFRIMNELKEQGEMALTGFDDWELDALKVTYDHIEDLLNEDFSDTGKSEPNSYTMTFTLPEEVHEAMDKYIDENPAGKVELAQLLVNKAKGLI